MTVPHVCCTSVGSLVRVFAKSIDFQPMESNTPGASSATSLAMQGNSIAPSHMVAVPGGITSHTVSGSGGAGALVLPNISLRRVDWVSGRESDVNTLKNYTE